MVLDEAMKISILFSSRNLGSFSIAGSNTRPKPLYIQVACRTWDIAGSPFALWDKGKTKEALRVKSSQQAPRLAIKHEN